MSLTNFSHRDHPELMQRLTRAQGSFPQVDILTFAAWCDSLAALEAHVEYYELQAEFKAAQAAAKPKRRRAKVAA